MQKDGEMMDKIVLALIISLSVNFLIIAGIIYGYYFIKSGKYVNYALSKFKK